MTKRADDQERVAVGRHLVTATRAVAVLVRTVVVGMDALVADTEQIGAGELPQQRHAGLRGIDLVAGAYPRW